MKRIPLTCGKFAIVDDCDYDFISQWKWYAAKQPKTFYAARSVKFLGMKKTYWMHRLINKTPENKITDHINGNGLDNRRKNLRSVTHQENMINNKRHKTGSSKYRGVSWHSRSLTWIAQITVNGKNKWIGTFDTEYGAYKAYLAARAKLQTGKIYKK